MAKKRAKRVSSKTDSEKLDQIINLLQTIAALELYRSGVKQSEIGKHLGIATVSVNKILKSVNRDN